MSIGSTLIEMKREANLISFEVEAHYDEYNQDYLFQIEVDEKNEIIMISYEGQDLEPLEEQDAEIDRAKSVVLRWLDFIEEFAKSGEYYYAT